MFGEVMDGAVLCAGRRRLFQLPNRLDTATHTTRGHHIIRGRPELGRRRERRRNPSMVFFVLLLIPQWRGLLVQGDQR